MVIQLRPARKHSRVKNSKRAVSSLRGTPHSVSWYRSYNGSPRHHEHLCFSIEFVWDKDRDLDAAGEGSTKISRNFWAPFEGGKESKFERPMTTIRYWVRGSQYLCNKLKVWKFWIKNWS